jgi:flagellin-like protein
MNRGPENEKRGTEAVSSTVGTVLLIAIAVILAAFIGTAALNYLEDGGSEPPPVVGITVEQKNVDIGSDSECSGPEEVALDVTLVDYTRAEEIFVAAEGGRDHLVWSNTDNSTVGEKKRLMNEPVGVGGTDVDIGGGGDFALCPGDEETFVFYAEWKDERTVVREVEVE